jgi:hypothetical protein
MQWNRQITYYIVHLYWNLLPKVSNRRCRWARGLNCEPAAARLLELRVRIRRGQGCLSGANVVCCQVKVPVPRWSLVQSSLVDYGVSECDLVTSTTRMHSPKRAVKPWNKMFVTEFQFSDLDARIIICVNNTKTTRILNIKVCPLHKFWMPVWWQFRHENTRQSRRYFSATASNSFRYRLWTKPTLNNWGFMKRINFGTIANNL